MIAMLLATALAVSPPSLAMPGVNSVGLDKGTAALLSEIFVQEMTRRGLRVLSGRDIEAVIGLERNRELLGCADKTACLAELAGALGVEGIVIGDLGKIGDSFAVNMKVIQASDGTTLALFNARTKDETQLPAVLTQAAVELIDQLTNRKGWATPERHPVPLRLWAIIPGVVGLAGVGVAAVEQVQAQQQWANLRVAPSLEAAITARDTGRSQELVGNIAVGVGVAGIAAAVVLLVIPEPASVRPVAWASPSGGGLGLAGALP